MAFVIPTASSRRMLSVVALLLLLPCLLLWFVGGGAGVVEAFTPATTTAVVDVVPTSSPSLSSALRQQRIATATRRSSSRLSTTKLQSFFKDLLNSAFENDESLSKEDKLEGMLDEGFLEEQRQGGNLYGMDRRQQQELTETQKLWRQKMLKDNTIVTPDDVVDTVWNLDMYLTGIPSRDPSNDLFASKTNISSRDRTTNQVLPELPTVSNIQLQFLDNDNKCRVLQDESGFCRVDGTDEEQATDLLGDWKLSDDGQQIRFRVYVNGYTRTVETKGTIQKVYWSKEDEKKLQTSTVYSIPDGWLYGEVNVSCRQQQQSQRQRQLVIGDNDQGGVLKIEQNMGLLGAASKMIPCGKFTATTTTIMSSSDNDEETSATASSSRTSSSDDE